MPVLQILVAPPAVLAALQRLRILEECFAAARRAGDPDDVLDAIVVSLGAARAELQRAERAACR